jgi:ATP-dependent helicase/nuclease subunit B
MADAHLTEIVVAPAGALAALAGDILADHAGTAPDLSGAVVVLPNLHAAAALAGALGARAGCALLLPRSTTLATWCAATPLPIARITDAGREIALFDALRGRNWFDAPDLWPLATELAALFDDLTRHSLSLPDSAEDFMRRIEAAYQARAGEPMQFEAKLVHELWRAFSRPAGDDVRQIDGAGLRGLQLARIAEQATAPLYAMGLPQLTPAEREFLELYARRAPVRLYRVDAAADDASLTERFLRAAWPDSLGDAGDLRARARSFPAQCADSPVSGRLALFGASSLEQEARAVDAQVRRWLLDGRERIAVVALDRMAARRARALLERARIMVQDETGWVFSTTSASTVVMRWLETLSGDFYHLDLLDLLKSPFVFFGWADRREAVYRFERIVRAESVVAGLDSYADAARADPDGGLALELLERLRNAARLFPVDRRRRPHDWLALLFASLRSLGVDEGLRSDPAGLQLWELLELRSSELAGTATVFSFAEWRRWLNRQLEAAEFRDSGISSPVAFTQLSLTRLRAFDAVVLVGCDAAHLPGPGVESVFFNESVRAQLGLPTSEQRIAQIRDDLIGLLSRCGSALVTWQKLRNGEPNLPSPLFERLEVFHQMAWRGGLEDGDLAERLPQAVIDPPLLPGMAQAPLLPAGTMPPAPVLDSARIPARISASGYNSLVACPYQFYARYALGLREPDEVRETLEKRDFGEYVHRILRDFHARFSSIADRPRAEIEDLLAQISDRVFRAATEADYLSHAWALRWRALIPRYLDWQLDRERDGWRFHAAEMKREIVIELPGGGSLTLEGRLDRVDRRDSQGMRTFAVLDYKTRNAKALKDALATPGEDVQLPVYAALISEPVEGAFYLSLDRDAPVEVPVGDDIGEAVSEAVGRLREIFAALHAGAPAPAQGIDAACEWCEMKGLCRKDYWS